MKLVVTSILAQGLLLRYTSFNPKTRARHKVSRTDALMFNSGVGILRSVDRFEVL